MFAQKLEFLLKMLNSFPDLGGGDYSPNIPAASYELVSYQAAKFSMYIVYPTSTRRQGVGRSDGYTHASRKKCRLKMQ